MRLIAVANQKGGVGKTTTTLNVAHALALGGRRVAVLDLDPQANLTVAFGFVHPRAGMDQVLRDGVPPSILAVPARDQIRLVPAGFGLARLEAAQDGVAIGADRLKEMLDGEFQDCDLVLIDCPPASGLLVVNALFATDEVLTPVATDYLSLVGLSHLLGTFRQFERRLGRKLQQWIAITRYTSDSRLAREVEAKLRSYFPGRVLDRPVREDSALAESPSFGKTIFEYRNDSPGAWDYRVLAEDLLQRRTMR